MKMKIIKMIKRKKMKIDYSNLNISNISNVIKRANEVILKESADL